MVEEGHLVYDLNHYTNHQVLRSTEALPAGTSEVRMRFIRDEEGTGERPRSLSVASRRARRGLRETFEHFVAFQGLDVGRDGLSPVREDGVGEFPFEGRIDRVVIELLSGLHGRSHEPAG